jgi:GTP diphosphokinase / guanosine-3',5'-bis(diphosphate) 3'-diphosphatase
LQRPGGARHIIAALLHDTVDNAEVTKEELVESFCSDVADQVMEVTDDKSLPKAERKRLQIATAPKKSARAQVI